MSSTELFEAASSSWTLKEALWLKARHESHWSQASVSVERFVQLIVLARMRAQVVLPTPRGPQNRNAWASLSAAMAFLRVVVTWAWPTTLAKVVGRYFRAETTNRGAS